MGDSLELPCLSNRRGDDHGDSLGRCCARKAEAVDSRGGKCHLCGNSCAEGDEGCEGAGSRSKKSRLYGMSVMK